MERGGSVISPVGGVGPIAARRIGPMQSEHAVWLNWGETPPVELRRGALAIGNFDGVHRGHAELVRVLRESARPAVVLSFDPHPLQWLAPERFQPELTTPADRAEFLRDCGADGVCFLRTTPSLLQLSPTEFFRRIVRDGFDARAVVEGFNFRFGRDRAGDVELLRELCQEAGLAFHVVPPVHLDGRPVSSSRVREVLIAGQVEEARRLLGRPYRLRGIVGTGAKRGRQLGFPTANLEQMATLIPGDGVYAVHATWSQWTGLGAAHIGPAPTFSEHARRVEVHVLDFAGDLYGRELTVHFLRRIRPTRRFAQADELMQQLRRDVEEVRRLSHEEPP